MRPRFPASLIALAAASVLLAACQGGGSDEGSAVTTAKTYIEQRDFKSAVISAKNAIQMNPQSGEARYLLGRALLETGDPAAAAVELRKARELGIADSAAVPLLAQAMLARGESRQVIVEFASLRLDDARASADLKTSVATAHAAVGERDAALETVQAALKEWPQHTEATLLHARLIAAGGDLTAALAMTEQLLAREPKNGTALLFKGALQRYQVRDDDKTALATFRDAVAANPESVPAHAAIVALLLEKKDLEGAKVQFGKLKAIAPGHVETRIFEAQLSYIDKDFAKTREITAQLLKVLPNHPLLLQLAGGAELRLNALAPAENYLTQAVKVAPQALVPRQMLARLYLRTGQGKRAIDALQPVLASENADPASLTLAGQAYLQEGDSAKSEAMFARAAKIDPKNTMARTALALNKLSKGNADGGFAELEATAASDEGSRADMALISARLRAADLKGALKAIDGLEKKQPDQPLAPVLRGRVLALQKDMAGARANFEKALQRDPQYYAAVASLAALDMAAGKPQDAGKRFEDLLKTDPKNSRAMLGLAELKARTGAPAADVAQLMGDAVKVNPSDPAPRTQLVRYLLGAGDQKAALAAAQEATVALPNSTDMLEQLGMTQLAAGQAQQAVTTYAKLASLRPNRPEPELALAEAHMAAKDMDAAKRSLERALKIQPDSMPAQAGLAKVAVMEKRHGDALKIARSLQQAQPKQPAAFLLEADIENDRGNREAAVAPLRTAASLSRDPQPSIYLHRTLVTLGKKVEAEQVAAAWRKDHPRDVVFRFYQGDTAMARNEFSAAEAHYRGVTEVQPDNALALNNIAWLMVRQQKPGAVAVAERANQLLPNKAPLMDTLALALVSENQGPRALELQKKALAAAPNEAGLKLTLAKIYLKVGDRALAKAELEGLAKMGDRFAGQAEVTELMKTL